MTRLRRGVSISVVLAALAGWSCEKSRAPDTVVPAATTQGSSASRTTTTARGDDLYVTPSDTGPVLHLSVAMDRALKSTFPRFSTLPWSAYPTEARNAHQRDTSAAVRWVTGDFDGDGRPDVAIDGQDTSIAADGKRTPISAIVALLSRGDSAIAIRVRTGYIDEAEALDTLPTRRHSWLGLVSARTYVAYVEHDAVGVTSTTEHVPKFRGRVYLWMDGGFVRFEHPN